MNSNKNQEIFSCRYKMHSWNKSNYRTLYRFKCKMTWHNIICIPNPILRWYTILIIINSSKQKRKFKTLLKDLHQKILMEEWKKGSIGNNKKRCWYWSVLTRMEKTLNWSDISCSISWDQKWIWIYKEYRALLVVLRSTSKLPYTKVRSIHLLKTISNLCLLINKLFLTKLQMKLQCQKTLKRFFSSKIST